MKDESEQSFLIHPSSFILHPFLHPFEFRKMAGVARRGRVRWPEEEEAKTSRGADAAGPRRKTSPTCPTAERWNVPCMGSSARPILARRRAGSTASLRGV